MAAVPVAVDGRLFSDGPAKTSSEPVKNARRGGAGFSARRARHNTHRPRGHDSGIQGREEEGSSASRLVYPEGRFYPEAIVRQRAHRVKAHCQKSEVRSRKLKADGCLLRGEQNFAWPRTSRL